MKRKGIILAGGTGSRLFPLTISVNKQLLPIYDKPLIYYPLSTLMLAGVKDILLICSPNDKKKYQNLLHDGSNLGIKISYKIQDKPYGLAHSFILAEEFLNNSPCILILGDNIFYGNNLIHLLNQANKNRGCTLFGCKVQNPNQFGIVSFYASGKPKKIIEKPKKFVSNTAIVGLYFYDQNVVKFAKTLKPSKRGELEITDLNKIYLKKKMVKIQKLGRGFAWFDTGNNNDMLLASNFISTVQNKQNTLIGSPEEISITKKLINKEKIMNIFNKFKTNQVYLNHLKEAYESSKD